MTMQHAFARGLDYASIVAASERVAWTVDGVFADRRFDPSGPIVPSAWVGVDGLAFLADDERLVLNHCRAFSYVHLIGNLEEFVPVQLADRMLRGRHDDRAHLRALMRFSDEELKHQQLFRRAEHVLEASCGHPFGRYFDPAKTVITALTRAILDRSSLAIFLMALAFEWGTQRHFVESIRDDGGADPLYVDVLKAHWIEEAQHTKCDLLEIARLASWMSPAAVTRAFDDLLALAAVVDTAFAGQAVREIETLESVTGRTFGDAERAALSAALHASLSRILAGVGLGHPGFAQVSRELSAEGARLLGFG